MREIIEKIKELGVNNTAVILTDDIPFVPELIDFCKMNTCGNYGKCWVCPPLVGETEELIEAAKSYKQMLVFQTVYPLEDSFDFEGMEEAKKRFRQLTVAVGTVCKAEFPDSLLLSAGGCDICETCAAADDEPCRFPERAYSSLEAYGIFVSKLAEAVGLKYINGPNTVTYFGGVLV